MKTIEYAYGLDLDLLVAHYKLEPKRQPGETDSQIRERLYVKRRRDERWSPTMSFCISEVIIDRIKNA